MSQKPEPTKRQQTALETARKKLKQDRSIAQKTYERALEHAQREFYKSLIDAGFSPTAIGVIEQENQ